MFQSDFRAAPAGLSLRETILMILRSPDLHTEYDGCTLGGLFRALEDTDINEICDAVQSLIHSGDAYFAEPLELANADSYLMPVRWTIGVSTRAIIETEFGRPHGVTHQDGCDTLTYDLFVQNADDPDYPPPPAPYSERESANECRPANCGFPFTCPWPPEALQIEFAFDRGGLLARFAFIVGNRLT